MQTLQPVFPLLAWCLELPALQHRPEQTPWSVQAEFYLPCHFQSSSEHVALIQDHQNTAKSASILGTINSENHLTPLEVEKLRHRKVKQLTYICTIQGKLEKRRNKSFSLALWALDFAF